MANFRLVDRGTSYLLPPSVDEWLPADHSARFVVKIVDQLDIPALESSYTGSGSDAHHPRMMAALLSRNCASGTFSSRKIEAATYESVPVRYVAAGMGLTELGDVSIDGSKFKINARKHKAMSWKRACALEDQLSEEVAELLEKAQAADADDEDGQKLPIELERRQAKADDCRAGRPRTSRPNTRPRWPSLAQRRSVRARRGPVAPRSRGHGIKTK